MSIEHGKYGNKRIQIWEPIAHFTANQTEERYITSGGYLPVQISPSLVNPRFMILSIWSSVDPPQ